MEKPEDHPHYNTRFWDEQGKEVTDNMAGDDSRVIMDRAIPFIEKATDAKQSFFAVVWFHAPHLPVVAGKEFTNLYPNENKYTQHYFGCITALDVQVGRLRDKLRELGIEKETMVFYCADNGPEGSNSAPGTPGPLRGRKRAVYEGGVRVPGILEWPGRVAAGRTTDVPMSTLDYLPTVVELLGLKLSDVLPEERPLDGTNLAGLVDGDIDGRSTPIPFYLGGKQALTDNRYKLVRSGGKDELYDIVADPGEQNDLATEKPEIVQQMRKQYDAWRESELRSAQGADYR